MDITKSTKIYMKKKGWNQEQLAEHLGISPAAVSTMLRRGSCNSDTILKLANVFGVKASAFIKKGES